MKREKLLIALAAGAGLVGAAAVIYSLVHKDNLPKGATAVTPFDLDRFMGKWYEFARLPNKVERNLADLTEEYIKQPNGSIKVITSACNLKTGKWTEVTGTLKPAGPEDTGMLKVSYFKPVYFAYNILDVDDDYQYALVSGSRIDTLWILSRGTTIPNDIKARFLYKAASIGFAIDRIEWQYGALSTTLEV
ncbi:hypothetical protein A0256_02720 [Mucilaginibacter sp. PAMC 26640]|nr:hypothetical protein A0256_02720 [Mucilaginibacter sp. PAMC 26640]